MKTATLKIIVEYQDGDDTAIESTLRGLAMHAASRGFLDNHGQLTVESWDCDVAIEESQPEPGKLSEDRAMQLQKQLEDDWS